MEITLKGNYETRQVWMNGKDLSPAQSQKIRNHSPDGFSWGYEGSGCAQLALAILLKFYVKEFAQDHYQDFKRKVISSIPQTDFDVIIKIDDKANPPEFTFIKPCGDCENYAEYDGGIKYCTVCKTKLS